MAGRRILIVMGSPRQEGNSATLARQIAAGAEAHGADVETVILHGMKIQPCTACGKCQEETSRGCVIDDDMQTLYPSVREADAIVLASPVYWFTISAQTKLFLDRCYALGRYPDEGLPVSAFTGKQIAIALAYGDVDPFCSGAVNALRTFQDAFNYVRADIIGMVYGSATHPGEIRDNREVMGKAYEIGKQLGS